MDNLLLKKRFIPSKRKFIGRTAEYWPTGITKSDDLKSGSLVMIKSEPQGGEEKIVDVAIVTRANKWSKEIECDGKRITVFLKDLSPIGAFEK